MAAPTQDLIDFAQSVYRAIKNRQYDDITSDDGLTFLNLVVDFTNQFIDELELSTNPDGTPVYWNWVRQMGARLGTARQGEASIDLDTDINELIPGENRYVQILQGSAVISNFAVVSPDNISSFSDRITQDMCTVVSGQIIFSRQLRDTENNGTIIGDITVPIPRVSFTDMSVLTVVKPRQLLVLGVAKNETLPDIVQGKLSPSYAQKFDNLLQGAIARNNASAIADTVGRDNYGYIAGVGF
jgi:hypothetical protein